MVLVPDLSTYALNTMRRSLKESREVIIKHRNDLNFESNGEGIQYFDGKIAGINLAIKYIDDLIGEE